MMNQFLEKIKLAMHSPPTGEPAWSSDSLYYHLSKENEIEREQARKIKPICKENYMLYLEAIIYNDKMNKI
jgi:hypothetical protein